MFSFTPIATIRCHRESYASECISTIDEDGRLLIAVTFVSSLVAVFCRLLPSFRLRLGIAFQDGGRT